jgi:hypothetical protein
VSEKSVPWILLLAYLASADNRLQYLDVLLPALQKHKCLEPASLVTKPRRSKWVKAFIDLIHPAGPWGGFSNTPAMDSSARHSFKSYRVRKIHEQLQKYNGLDRGHLQLKDALYEFYEREQYQKDFLAACETYCLQEVKKPMGKREWVSGTAVAFNSPATTAPVVAAAPAMLVARATERSGIQSIEEEEEEIDCPITVPATPTDPTASVASAAELSNKRPAEEESLDTERPTCRRRYHGDDSDGSGQNENNQYDDAEEVDSSLQTSTPPLPSNGSGINERQCAPSLVSPSSPSSTPVEMTTTTTSVTPSKQDKDDRKLHIQDKRAELVSFLTLRRQTLSESSESPAGDVLCQKIQGKIDQLDEELFELIAC